MTFKLVIFFLFSWVNLSFSQEIQIRMKTKSYFDAPVIGKVNLYQTTVLAKNQKKTYETANIEKRLEDGAKRFDKLENMIWAVYPFILVSLVLSRFV